MTFEPLKNVLNRVLADKKMKAKFSAAEVCVVAENTFAAELPQFSEKFRVKFIKNKVLYVAAENSSIASEMRFAEMTVFKAIAKLSVTVRQVRYSVGPLPERVTRF